ncbi:UDP-glucose dehydrogenase family protein [Rothia uropygioeca]|uniref:UDP-glucose dehydrogenase family protein n=1 Tax=Kocuria sp. 257 TaxID=2021970 RepID=UPI001013941A|nr:UDP-glucose/GDP-mannose dehydrogenase family protein [Kocuria sp. 257]
MQIAVFGSGYVGLVTSACLADGGHEVTCVDVDAARVRRLQGGESPIFEPGLDRLLARNLENDRLHFTTDAGEALDGVEAVFIAVGTPQATDGSADLRAVDAVAQEIGRRANRDMLVINKSTVPVGTAARVGEAIRRELNQRYPEGESPRVGVASNPEFLKEGTAIADFKHGERVVIGTANDRDATVLREIYEPFNRQREKIIAMDVASAELTKYAANAMLAAKISLMNEIAGIAEATGADIEKVRLGVGSDSRIGQPFLYAGAGYGGSCFPKDIAALAHVARDAGRTPRMLKAVEDVNAEQKTLLFQKLSSLVPSLEGKIVAVWGLSFKPKTDDVREAPSLDVVRSLLAVGSTVRVYDPVAADSFRAAVGQDEGRVIYAETKEDSVEGADALVICTEWEEFRVFDTASLSRAMRGRVIVDGRNLYDPERVAEAGFVYASIGRTTTGLPG